MNDRTTDIDADRIDDRVVAAFDDLRREAGNLDTMPAYRAVTDGRTRWSPSWMLPVAIAAAVLVVIGTASLIGGDRETLTSGGDGDQGPGIAEPGSLAGTSWTLLDGSASGSSIPIVDGWPITLVFDDETLGGTSACNGYGGSYSVTDPPRIAIGGLGGTDMGCGGEVMASERAYLDALVAVTEIEYADEGQELLLTGPDVRLRFGINEPVPTARIVGQLWLLETLIQGSETIPASGAPALLLLNADGTLEGGTGCRSLSGQYVVSGNEILFTTFGADGGPCLEPVDFQDNVVVSVLGDGFVPSIEQGNLVLTSTGAEGLVYRPISDADEIPDHSPTPEYADVLVDTRWLYAEGGGPDGEISSGGVAVTLEFTARSIRGAAHCNDYGAAYTIVGDRIEVGPIEAEQEGCSLAPQEAAFFAALADIEIVMFFDGGDRLALSGGASELNFDRVSEPEKTPTDGPTVQITIDLDPSVDNGELTVRVEDVSSGDNALVILGSTTVGAESRFVEVVVDGDYPDDALLIVTAHLDVDEDGLVSPGDYQTSADYPVLTRGSPTAVTIVLERVGAEP